MRKHHPENERIKRQYLNRLVQVRGMATSSVDQVAAAIAQFEVSTNYRDFKKFHVAQAQAFKEQLQSSINPETGRPLAKATIRSRLMAMKAFVTWLAEQPGYRSRIKFADAEYFNQTSNDENVATAVRQRPVPTIAEIRRAIEAMQVDTLIQRRDRTVVVFALLSGARDNAIASFRLKHIDTERRTVFQDAREVRTKFAKTFTSSYFPVAPDLEWIVANWIDELVYLGFGPDDPLFPATEVKPGANRLFVPVGLTRAHWKDAGPIRRIFKAAFEAASISYYHPHSFRHTIARYGEKLGLTPEEWRAYSQNFGHSSPMTTFNSYAPVPEYRQAEILNQLATPGPDRAPEILPVRLDDDQMRILLEGLRQGQATLEANSGEQEKSR